MKKWREKRKETGFVEVYMYREQDLGSDVLFVEDAKGCRED